MNYRDLKGIAISEIGLGTWQLGSADWGEVDEEKSLGILAAFADKGGNFIDTADVYGMGISERVIGKFLSNHSSPMYVATKLGRRSDHKNGWPQNFTYDLMKQHAEESLKNLGLSQLFLEQLHCIPKEQMAAGKVFDNLRKLKEEGIIRFWGASVETVEEALICMEQEGIASIQLIFNLFRQHVADELFEKAREKDIALIVRVPLASGLLTGKFTEKTVFNPTDHRTYNANGESFNAGETFSGIEFKQGVQFAEELSAVMPDGQLSQWAMRWILDHPQVTTVIPGSSTAIQVESNVKASSLDPLSPEIHRTLRTIYDRKIHSTIRGQY